MSYRLRHPGSVIAVALDHRIAEKLGLDAGSDGKASRQRGFPVIARRVVEARSTLFREGEMAHSYFVLASGEMLATRWNKSQSRETTRTVVSGDMFIFNCDDRHMATCCATLDSVVWLSLIHI